MNGGLYFIKIFKLVELNNNNNPHEICIFGLPIKFIAIKVFARNCLSRHELLKFEIKVVNNCGTLY